MPKHRTLFAALLFTLPLQGLAAEPASTAPELAQKMLPEITAWRRDLHQHPELSNRELRTSKLVASARFATSSEVSPPCDTMSRR